VKTFEHFIRFQLPAVTWALLIFIASSIPESKLPKVTRMVDDKIVHATIYFVLGLLVYRALEPRNPTHTFSWKRLLISIAVVIVYGITDEYHQGFVPGRTEDVLDATADTVGGLLSAAMMFLIEHRKQRTQNAR
jgi:VanZ family protein